MTMLNRAVSPTGRRETARGLAVLTALGGLLFAGCRHDATPTAPSTTDQVGLAIVDNRGLAEAVARCRGKVVLVEFWATWCAPCVKLFPHTVELHRRLADRGLVVISVSMDDTASREAVLRFLRHHQAVFDNFISQYGLGSEGFDAFDINGGALPQLKLYDRNGRLQKIFSSIDQSVDHEQIECAVAELLKM